jgi:hypothetical protein
MYWFEPDSAWGTHLNGVVLCTPVDGDLYLFWMINESLTFPKNKLVFQDPNKPLLFSFAHIVSLIKWTCIVLP